MILNDEEIKSLDDTSISTIRAWSLKGTPTSPMFTLGLIETIYELQEKLRDERAIYEKVKREMNEQR